MATSNQGIKHLLQTLGRALGRELDLWIPVLSVDSQKMNQDMRSDIIEWLASLNNMFGFSLETLFLTIDIYDRFLHRVKAQTKYLKCIAVTCFYLASKINEEDEIIPLTPELVERSECGCSAAEVLRMERCILSKLNWDLKPSSTSIEFAHLFYSLVLAKCPSLRSTASFTTILQTLNQALVLCLPHAELHVYTPSTVALTVLSLYLELTWDYWLAATKTLQTLVQLNDEEFSECRKLVSQFLGGHLLDAIRNNVGCRRVKSAPMSSAVQHIQMITPPANETKEEQMDSSSEQSLIVLPPSLPVTPHPPAKRRRVEQDDDVYDDIRSLYDAEESSWSTTTLGVRATSFLNGVAMSPAVGMSSCACQVLRISGAVPVLPPIATS